MELSAAPLDPPHGKHNLLADELAFGLTVIHATPPTGWFMGSHRAVGSAGYVASSSQSQVQARTARAAGCPGSPRGLVPLVVKIAQPTGW